MFSKIFSATAAALAVTQLVSAQTFTECDPRFKSCPANPALGKENILKIDFTKGKNDFFKMAEGTKLTYGDKGAEFTMKKETEAPTVSSTKYIFFGKIDVVARAAPGTGIVTSIVLQSDDRDEIDWEWLGGDEYHVQTNYFGKGDDSTFDRGGVTDIGNPQDNFHTYTIDWTKDYVHWIIDGTLVRELKYADAKDGSRFPQTPSQIKLGSWVAGSSTAPEGTVDWAGGLADFSKGPHTAYYKSVTIQDYAGGVANAKQYVWADGSDGSWQSIKVETTDGKTEGGDFDEDTSSDSSTTTTAKTTTSATKTSTSNSATKTITTLVTSTATNSNVPVSSNAPNRAASNSVSPTSTPTDDSSSLSPSPNPTAAAFRPSLNGALVGAGILAALVL